MSKSVFQIELEKIIGDCTQKELILRIKPIFHKRFRRQKFPSQSSISRYFTGEGVIRKDILECIFEAYSISDADCFRLMTAAGHSTEQVEHIQSTALQQLLLVLQDESLPNDVKDNIQRDVEVVISGWQTYAQIELLNYQHKWFEANKLYNDKAQVTTNKLSRLPHYLKVMNARTVSHLYPEKNPLQLLQDSIATDLSEEDLHFSALLHATRGSLFRDEGSWDKAIDNFNDAIHKFKQLDAPELVHKMERKKAVLHLLRGDWNKAEAPLKRCRDFFKEHNLIHELAKTHYDLGWVYNLSGDWDQANEHNKAGLEIAQSVLKINDSLQIDNVGVTAFKFLELLGLSFQGNDARQKGNSHDAVDFYKKAEEILVNIPDRREESWVFLGIGRVYAQLASYHQARNERKGGIDSLRVARIYFERAIESGKSAKYYYRLAMAQTHYARFLLNQGEINSATEIIEEAITSAGRANAFYYLNQAKVVACEIYRFQKQFDRVQRLIREIQKEYDDHHFDRLMARIRVIEAGIALEQKSINKAAELCAQALHHALAYNKPTVEEIQKTIKDEFTQANKEDFFTQNSDPPFYSQIAEYLTSELKSRPLFYDLRRGEMADQIIKDLRKQSKIR